MPSLDSLAAIVANPTVLSLIGVVGLVLAMRLRRLKWRDVELSFGRDDGDQPPNSRR
ncbi:hypothetical protein [uncultured Bosea sp.]|jgi:hypothetical protein|uniref:hypothetical protein n=1 Tax=uncultured Bosea sp. TaxID=211457 RepID=UPI0025E78254|nr:hypothetical protein [uncultured Bosea sp.]